MSEGHWITVNGTHIYVGGDEDADTVVKSFFANRANANQAEKERQLNNAKEQASQASGNSSQVKLDDGYKSVPSEKFHDVVADAKANCSSDIQWRVDAHTAAEYTELGAKCIQSSGGSTIAVTKDGDIISVCKRGDDLDCSGRDLMAAAVKNGGNKLDSFEGNHGFYVKCGFEPVSWTPFNKDYAPEGWKESGCGEEAVVFYKYVGIGNVKNISVHEFKAKNKPYTGDDGYDKAMEYRNKHMK